MARQDREIEQYRELMEPPDHYETGFGMKAIVGALFLGFLMVPGSIYMSLFIGQGLGPAARWVTVILFAEVAKRSMKSLKQQEIFILFYMTGIALGGGMAGGAFSGLLWNQYFVQSPAATGMGVASEIPWWVAPPAEVVKEAGRTFFHTAWLGPILFIAGMMLIERIDHFGLGYALYRVTSHIEKLPFPMAPVGALGVTALAEAHDPAERWRWRCFSLGGVLGLMFGFVYVGVPTLTSSLFGQAVQIIPIPWLDLTDKVSTENFMPAVPLNIVLDVSMLLVGMVLPFWAVVGGFVGLLFTWAVNPVLYNNGVLTHWEEGMGVVDTLFSNQIDFYLSFGIGLAFAIFIISMVPIMRQLLGGLRRFLFHPSPEDLDPDQPERMGFFKALVYRNRDRGDISILVSLTIYLLTTFTYISICVILIPGDPVTGKGRFPWMFFLGISLLYRPLIGYVNAKLEGVVGQNVQIPMFQQVAYILSGFQGAQIWFAPVPLTDHSIAVRSFREMELIGVRISGIIRTELMAIPILLVCSIVFSQMIFRLAAIPSDAYPYTVEVWRLQALNSALTITATMEGSSPFMEAIKPPVIGSGLAVGLLSFILLSFLHLPTFLVYGAVRGMNGAVPGHLFFELIGALIGRFYLEKKFGHQAYKKYVMIMVAGWSAGMGLVAMAAVAVALIAKSTTTLGY